MFWQCLNKALGCLLWLIILDLFPILYSQFKNCYNIPSANDHGQLWRMLQLLCIGVPPTDDFLAVRHIKVEKKMKLWMCSSLEYFSHHLNVSRLAFTNTTKGSFTDLAETEELVGENGKIDSV